MSKQPSRSTSMGQQQNTGNSSSAIHCECVSCENTSTPGPFLNQLYLLPHFFCLICLCDYIYLEILYIHFVGTCGFLSYRKRNTCMLVKSESLFIEVCFVLSTVLGALRHVKID